MFFLLLRRSFARGFRHKLLAVVTIAAAATLATAMLNVSLDVGDKVARQLRGFGANLVLSSQMSTLSDNETYLAENELAKIKTVFWRNNILSFSPFLEKEGLLKKQRVKITGTWFDKKLVIPTGETFTSRLSKTRPWQKIKGRWPDDKKAEVALSSKLAKKLNIKIGENVNLKTGNKPKTFSVSGSLPEGEEPLVFIPLKILQEETSLQGKVSKVEVSALTNPDNALAKKYQQDPDSLTSKEWERWYCTAYVDAIAFQLEEAIPSARADIVRQLAHAESIILGKIQFFMAVLTIAAIISAALGISSLITTTVLERASQIGLAKAIGASNFAVVGLFLAEATIMGVIGAFLGYFTGLGLAAFISMSVFKISLTVNLIVVPITLAVAVGVALLGSLAAARTIAALSPKEVLHGR